MREDDVLRAVDDSRPPRGLPEVDVVDSKSIGLVDDEEEGRLERVVGDSSIVEGLRGQSVREKRGEGEAWTSGIKRSGREREGDRAGQKGKGEAGRRMESERREGRREVSSLSIEKAARVARDMEAHLSIPIESSSSIEDPVSSSEEDSSRVFLVRNVGDILDLIPVLNVGPDRQISVKVDVSVFETGSL